MTAALKMTTSSCQLLFVIHETVLIVDIANGASDEFYAYTGLADFTQWLLVWHNGKATGSGTKASTVRIKQQEKKCS